MLISYSRVVVVGKAALSVLVQDRQYAYRIQYPTTHAYQHVDPPAFCHVIFRITIKYLTISVQK